MRFSEPMFLWGLFTLPLWGLLLAYAWRRRRRLSERFAAAMAACKTAPVWTNLDLLSAEDWVSG